MLMKIKIYDHEGTEHDLDAVTPTSLMEAIRDANLPIAAECGGNCACATCHVYIEDNGLDRLPARTEQEDGMLELAVNPQPNSRLSCQIRLTPEAAGLTVRLAPGSER
jgi:2Fe-2S ferredoxin